MINGKHVFVLDGEAGGKAEVDTEGGMVHADTVVGSRFSRGDYFDGEYVETFCITGQNGGFTVRASDVKKVVSVSETGSVKVETDIERL